MTCGVCDGTRQKGQPSVSSAYSESVMANSSPCAIGFRPVILKSSRVRKMHSSYECSERHVSMTAAMKKVKSFGAPKVTLLHTDGGEKQLDDAVDLKLDDHMLVQRDDQDSATISGGTPYRC
eukprot:5829256-Prymnesium_polylepis.1